jgi:hypothetical protein
MTQTVFILKSGLGCPNKNNEISIKDIAFSNGME